MNRAFQKILRFLTGRLFRNMLLWFFVCGIVAISNIPEDRKNLGIIFLGKTVSVLSLFCFTYFNNLYLIPKYLANRKRSTYAVAITASVILYALFYTLFIKLLINYYPVSYGQVIFLSIPFDKSWSLGSIIGGTVWYGFTYAMWTLVLTMAWFMNDYSRQQKAMIVAQKRQVETELNFLKSQINPHFLFNTLNNLYALALKKSDIAPDAILKLSAILRYLLYESNTATVSFDKEKEIMQAYIDLELLRLTDTQNLHFSIDADRPYNLPPLLWLPVLENVFKHGTRTISDNNHVEYMFEIKNEQLFIYTKNNEKMLAKRENEVGGIGLSNMKKRLELLYPGKHSILAKQEDNYYITEVKVDLA